MQVCEVVSLLIPFLKRRKLRHSKIKKSQYHPAIEWKEGGTDYSPV